jgi:hypothetical protein
LAGRAGCGGVAWRRVHVHVHVRVCVAACVCVEHSVGWPAKASTCRRPTRAQVQLRGADSAAGGSSVCTPEEAAETAPASDSRLRPALPPARVPKTRSASVLACRHDCLNEGSTHKTHTHANRMHTHDGPPAQPLTHSASCPAGNQKGGARMHQRRQRPLLLLLLLLRRLQLVTLLPLLPPLQWCRCAGARRRRPCLRPPPLPPPAAETAGGLWRHRRRRGAPRCSCCEAALAAPAACPSNRPCRPCHPCRPCPCHDWHMHAGRRAPPSPVARCPGRARCCAALPAPCCGSCCGSCLCGARRGRRRSCSCCGREQARLWLGTAHARRRCCRRRRHRQHGRQPRASGRRAPLLPPCCRRHRRPLRCLVRCLVQERRPRSPGAPWRCWRCRCHPCSRCVRLC